MSCLSSVEKVKFALNTKEKDDKDKENVGVKRWFDCFIKIKTIELSFKMAKKLQLFKITMQCN